MVQQNGNGQPENKIIIYTDPLCCWSWASRPQWQRLFSSVSSPMQVSYKMAGLLPSWKHFADTVNAISKPIQMGPEWMHARGVSGVPIDDRIWIADPPASSYPACIAVKAAMLQSPTAGEEYLYRVQKAVMTQRRNIAKREVLLDIAAGMRDQLDIDLFKADLFGDKARENFRKDMHECKFLHITRLPALIFKGALGSAMISGYQTGELLLRAAQNAIPL